MTIKIIFLVVIGLLVSIQLILFNISVKKQKHITKMTEKVLELMKKLRDLEIKKFK